MLYALGRQRSSKWGRLVSAVNHFFDSVPVCKYQKNGDIPLVIDHETKVSESNLMGYRMGFSPLRIMVLISYIGKMENDMGFSAWTVNCRLPSPTKRMTRLSAPSGSSLAARAAPKTAPTE